MQKNSSSSYHKSAEIGLDVFLSPPAGEYFTVATTQKCSCLEDLSSSWNSLLATPTSLSTAEIWTHAIEIQITYVAPLLFDHYRPWSSG